MAKKQRIQGKNRDYAVGKGKPPKEFQFKKGDPRINRLGRPKSFDALRTLVQEIGAEVLSDTGLSVLSEKIREMYVSNDPRNNATLLAYGWGKPKEEIEIGWRKKAIEQGYDPDEILQQIATTIAERGFGGSDSGGNGTNSAEEQAESDSD